MSLLAVISALLAGTGMVLQRKDLAGKKFSLKLFLKSKFWLLGTLLFGFSVIAYILAVKFHPISIVQPIINISLVTSLVLGWRFLKEKVNLSEIFGIIIIIIGVSMLVML